jgi:hypothetical protein
LTVLASFLPQPARASRATAPATQYREPEYREPEYREPECRDPDRRDLIGRDAPA